MPSPIRVRNARGELIEAAAVSASDAKNGFGRILARVATDGGVTITRRNEPIAVVIPVEAYARLAGAEAGMLDTLAAEFDALLERMQAPGMADAMQRAFDMPPDDLGAAAVRAVAAKPAARRLRGAPGPGRAAKQRAARG
jgi:prevent-host-death family protein